MVEIIIKIAIPVLMIFGIVICLAKMSGEADRTERDLFNKYIKEHDQDGSKKNRRN